MVINVNRLLAFARFKKSLAQLHDASPAVEVDILKIPYTNTCNCIITSCLPSLPLADFRVTSHLPSPAYEPICVAYADDG